MSDLTSLKTIDHEGLADLDLVKKIENALLSLFWSLLPQAFLGHDIKAAPIVGGLYLLLASTLTKTFRTRELLFALLVLPVFVLFTMTMI